MNFNGKISMGVVLGLALVASMTAGMAFARGGGGRGSGGHMSGHSMSMGQMRGSMPNVNFRSNPFNRSFTPSNFHTTNHSFSNHFANNAGRNSVRGITNFKMNQRHANRLAITRLGRNHRSKNLKNVAAKHFRHNGPYWRRNSGLDAFGSSDDCDACESLDGEFSCNPSDEDVSPTVEEDSAGPMNAPAEVVSTMTQGSPITDARQMQMMAAPVATEAPEIQATESSAEQTAPTDLSTMDRENVAKGTTHFAADGQGAQSVRTLQSAAGDDEDDDDGDDAMDAEATGNVPEMRIAADVKGGQAANETEDDDAKSVATAKAGLILAAAAGSATQEQPEESALRSAPIQRMSAMQRLAQVRQLAPTEPADSVTAPAASLAGAWKASPDAGVTIELTLNADATFAWKVTAKGNMKSFKGEYKLTGKSLVLTRAGDGTVLEGTLERKEEKAVVFRMKGSDDDDPGLSFTR